jgi:hypothetical protein
MGEKKVVLDLNGKAPTFNYIYEIRITDLNLYKIGEWVS